MAEQPQHSKGFSYLATDVVFDDDDDDDDDDDGRSELHNNPYTRGAYSYLATVVVVVVDDDDRSEWHTNPYTRGAYSYLATGVPLELYDVLRQPLPSLRVGLHRHHNKQHRSFPFL